MREATFQAGSTVPAGTVVALTARQADARIDQITPVKDRHAGLKDTRRLAYSAKTQLFFKAGETIGIEGVLDRVLANALGISQEEQAATRDAARSAREAAQHATAVKKAEKAVEKARAGAGRAAAALAKLQGAARPASADRVRAAERAVEAADDEVKSALAALAALTAEENADG